MAAAQNTMSVAHTFKPPPSAENTPAANRSESPGRNGKNTSPVSTNTIRNSGVYTHTGPKAMIPAGDEAARVFQKVDEKVDDAHRVSNLPRT